MLRITQSPHHPLAFHVEGCPEPDATHPALTAFFTRERGKFSDADKLRRQLAYNALKGNLVRKAFLDTEPGQWLSTLPAMPFIGGYSQVPDHHPLMILFTDPAAAMHFKLTWA